jgi:hypothetical protein
MIHRMASALTQLSRTRIVISAIVLTAASGLIDYVTGPEFAPLLFYLAPVGLVAWAGRRPDAVLVSLLGGSVWLLMEATGGRTYSSGWILGWAALTRLGVFLVVAGVVMALRREYFLERHLMSESGSSPSPPCPYCGSRDTVQLVRSLVCRSCQRSASLTDLPEPAS